VNATNRTLAKVTFLKALPLCLIAIGIVYLLKHLASIYFDDEINPLIFFFVAALICSWIFGKYISPIYRVLMDKENIEGKK
jgi:hypothetical protein